MTSLSKSTQATVHSNILFTCEIKRKSSIWFLLFFSCFRFEIMNQLSMSFDEHREINYFPFEPKTVVHELQKAIPELDLVGLVHSRKWFAERA